MSRRHSSAQTHRRRGRPGHGNPFHGAGDDVGVMAAWAADKGAWPEAKQRTHDTLIAMMGARRTGGVAWSITSGAEALRNLQLLDDDCSEAYRDQVVVPIRARLEAHGGWLVVAMAPGRAS